MLLSSIARRVLLSCLIVCVQFEVRIRGGASPELTEIALAIVVVGRRRVSTPVVLGVGDISLEGFRSCGGRRSPIPHTPIRSTISSCTCNIFCLIALPTQSYHASVLLLRHWHEACCCCCVVGTTAGCERGELSGDRPKPRICLFSTETRNQPSTV